MLCTCEFECVTFLLCFLRPYFAHYQKLKGHEMDGNAWCCLPTILELSVGTYRRMVVSRPRKNDIGVVVVVGVASEVVVVVLGVDVVANEFA